MGGVVRVPFLAQYGQLAALGDDAEGRLLDAVDRRRRGRHPVQGQRADRGGVDSIGSGHSVQQADQIGLLPAERVLVGGSGRRHGVFPFRPP